MKHASWALAASLLLAPLSAAATFETPSQLLTAIQASNQARSFSATAHAKSDDMYVSIWASGTEYATGSAAMEIWTKATVDIVRGAMKVRLKGEYVLAGGTLYAQISSINGVFDNAFGSMTTVARQKQWVKIPLDVSEIENLMGPSASLLGMTNEELGDNAFTLQATPGKNGNLYSLVLQPAFASELASMLRDMLGESEPVSTDFFPWRDLAEGMQFDMNIATNAQDAFLSSTFSINIGGAHSFLKIDGKKSALKNIPKLVIPKNAVDLSEALGMVNVLNGELPDTFFRVNVSPRLEDTEEYDFEFEDDNDFYDYGYDAFMDPICSDPFTTSLELLSLQRSGVCPVQKVPTRYTR